MFAEKPSAKVHSPLEKGDHPELDTSELLDQTGVQQYQSLIGSLQWAFSLWRFDIANAVMSLSIFPGFTLPSDLSTMSEHLVMACLLISYGRQTIVWIGVDLSAHNLT
jgi:hypothetical protein